MTKKSPPQRSANDAVENRIDARTEQFAGPHAGQRTDQRSDSGLQHIVNCAISVQSRSSTLCAVEYLKSHNVGADVIERVLSHRQQRRACTQ